MKVGASIAEISSGEAECVIGVLAIKLLLAADHGDNFNISDDESVFCVAIFDYSIIAVYIDGSRILGRIHASSVPIPRAFLFVGDFSLICTTTS